MSDRDPKAYRVPWLVWAGGMDWCCDRCGAVGTLPTGCSITTAVKFIRGLEADHRRCPEPPPPPPQ